MVNSGNRRHLPSSPFKPPPEAPPVERYELDDLVTHDRYGLGRIILVEGDTAVVVDFAPRKVRITTPFARMTKLLSHRTADQAGRDLTSASRALRKRRSGPVPARAAASS